MKTVKLEMEKCKTLMFALLGILFIALVIAGAAILTKVFIEGFKDTNHIISLTQENWGIGLKIRCVDKVSGGEP